MKLGRGWKMQAEVFSVCHAEIYTHTTPPPHRRFFSEVIARKRIQFAAFCGARTRPCCHRNPFINEIALSENALARHSLCHFLLCSTFTYIIQYKMCYFCEWPYRIAGAPRTTSSMCVCSEKGVSDSDIARLSFLKL
jgi:hypothetical protein